MGVFLLDTQGNDLSVGSHAQCSEKTTPHAIAIDSTARQKISNTGRPEIQQAVRSGQSGQAESATTNLQRPTVRQ
jgi:hypothetical protein